ncbi:energy transducer TonB [Swingsia samuiensis]|uniref:Protein TonB n=1 Tax=Swingsia samuiensis TaxID=1293412 RepID=A0A4Y6UJA7_9PROT|nr:energy transducer TonB [Swingsia samuiensis]QDH16718.1 energy transducer TonB [Swingsia samuiensis]
MKSYGAQQRKPTDYIVAIVVAVLAMGAVGYALISGKVTKMTQERPPIKTEVITEVPKPPPPPPPPPPPQMVPPPPPYIPPPRINVQPPPKAIKRVTHVKPPHPVPPSENPIPSPVPVAPTQAAAPKAPPAPSVPDHSAGAHPINGAKPDYPEEAQEESREGKVTASCDILPNGRTANCSIVSSSGGPEFSDSALEFLHRARYQPAVQNGVPVIEHHHILHVDFTLGDD